MDIKITVDLNQKEFKLLSRILEAKTEEELIAKLEKVASSATREYKAMILGQKVFTRGKDMQEFRYKAKTSYARIENNLGLATCRSNFQWFGH